MRYLLSIQVVRPSAKLGPLTRCLIVEGFNLAKAMDEMTTRLFAMGLHFYKLNYASHLEGPEVDKVVLPIYRGLKNDGQDLRELRNRYDSKVPSERVIYEALSYSPQEVEELIKNIDAVEEAIYNNMNDRT